VPSDEDTTAMSVYMSVHVSTVGKRNGFALLDLIYWLSSAVDKALNSWERKPGFKSYAAVLNVGQGRSLYKCCPSSLSCINECLAVNSGGYLYTNCPRTLIAVW